MTAAADVDLSANPADTLLDIIANGFIGSSNESMADVAWAPGNRAPRRAAVLLSSVNTRVTSQLEVDENESKETPSSHCDMEEEIGHERESGLSLKQTSALKSSNYAGTAVAAVAAHIEILEEACR